MLPAHVTAHFHTVDSLLVSILIDRDPAVFSYINTELHSDNYFHKLCQAIISQQLAGKAADAIFKRFVELFPNQSISAELLVEMPEQTLRDIGASWAKARYVKDLALKTIEKSIRYDQLASLSDEEVIAELTQVKGIGRWTAEMFLIFTLGREDVFSLGDLGLKNAFKKLYQVEEKDVVKKMTEVSMTWAPYRSYVSLALWSYLDNR